jgi:hypothetical protein
MAKEHAEIAKHIGYLSTMALRLACTGGATSGSALFTDSKTDGTVSTAPIATGGRLAPSSRPRSMVKRRSGARYVARIAFSKTSSHGSVDATARSKRATFPLSFSGSSVMT